jgi:hypothetical protein
MPITIDNLRSRLARLERAGTAIDLADLRRTLDNGLELADTGDDDKIRESARKAVGAFTRRIHLGDPKGGFEVAHYTYVEFLAEQDVF